MTTRNIDTAQIAEAAFYIWLEEGQPEGRDLEHWLRAQEALSKPKKAPAKRKAPVKAAAKPAKATAAAKTTATKPRKAKAKA